MVIVVVIMRRSVCLYNILLNDVCHVLAKKKKRKVSITILMIVWYVISIVHTNILDFIALVQVIYRKVFVLRKKIDHDLPI